MKRLLAVPTDRLVEIDPLTCEQYGRIGPEDIEEWEAASADGPGPIIRFSASFYLKYFGIDDASISAFAAEFRIADAEFARIALSEIARAVAEEGQTSEGVMYWRGQALDCAETDMQAYKLAHQLSFELHSLLDDTGWPVGANEASDHLVDALRTYAQWLNEFDVDRLVKRAENPGKPLQQLVAIYLAHVWQLLTGETPTSYPASGGKRPSPFYRACHRACEMLGLHPPSPSSVGNWVKRAKEMDAAPLDTESPADGA